MGDPFDDAFDRTMGGGDKTDSGDEFDRLFAASAPAPKVEAMMTVGEPTVIKSSPRDADPMLAQDDHPNPTQADNDPDAMLRVAGDRMGHGAAALERMAEAVVSTATPTTGATGVLGAAADNAVGGGIMGGLKSLQNSDPERSYVDRAIDALKAAGTDAGIGGIVGGGLAAAGRGLSSLATEAERLGWKNRAASAGFYGSTLDNLAKNKGEERVYEIGKGMEEAGLHKGSGLFGWAPQTAKTISENALELQGGAGKEMGSYEKALAGLTQPPTVDTAPIVSDLRSGAGNAAGMWDPSGSGEAAFRTNFANNIERGADSGGQAAWNDALAQRRYIDENINWNKKGGYPEAGMQEQVRRDVANGLRGEISDSLDRGMAAGNVPEDMGQGWQKARGNFELGADVYGPASTRANREAGNQLLSLPTWSAIGGGIATGNPLVGLASGVGAQLAKTRGRAAVAGTLGATADASRFIGGVGDWLGSQAPVGAMGADAFGGQPQPEPVPLRGASGVIDAFQQQRRADNASEIPQVVGGLQGQGTSADWVDKANAPDAIGALSDASRASRGQQPMPSTNLGTSGTGAFNDTNGSTLGDRFLSFVRSPEGARAVQPWASEFAGQSGDSITATYERLMRTDDKFASVVGAQLGAR